MPEQRLGLCNLCDAACGLIFEVEGRQVRRARGDPQDPLSRGHICPKGAAQRDLHHDPDRLRTPLRRRGSNWQAMPWDEALGWAGERLAQVQARHGSDALALYWGNPVVHHYGTMLALMPFVSALQTRNVYSSNSVDALPRMLVSTLMYGNQAAVPVPDLERTDLLLIIGANPVVSNGSAMSAPGIKRPLRAIQERGGTIVVVDPRRTETAALADQHIFIRPGTDPAFLLAVLHVLERRGHLPLARLEKSAAGLAELGRIAKRFAPPRAASVTGISVRDIEQVATLIARADSMACHGRMGTCTQRFGTLSTWAIDALSIASGNLDRPGGMMFPTPAVDLASLAKRIGQTGSFARWRSRVSGLPEFNGELPVAALPDELEQPGPGRIKALVTWAGNMVLSLPNGRRLERLLPELEFMVAIDRYLNETTRHAQLILPPASALESDHYPLLEYTLCIHNGARYCPPVLAKGPDRRDDWEIATQLAEQLDRHRGPGRRALGRLRSWLIGRALSPPRALDLLLRLGPHRLSLRQLRARPHGIDLGPLQPRLSEVLATRSRRIDLVPAIVRGELDRFEAALESGELDGDASLQLVSHRTPRSMNSWLHNQPKLARGGARSTLQMHPDDARQRGVDDGALVRLRSRVGAIETTVELTDEMMPGVVSLAFGWGHHRPGVRLAVAAADPGVSMNDITDDGLYDAPSGTSVLDGIPVEVAAIDGA